MTDITGRRDAQGPYELPPEATFIAAERAKLEARIHDACGLPEGQCYDCWLADRWRALARAVKTAMETRP